MAELDELAPPNAGTAGEAAPPGWYPNPSGPGRRYWDRGRWWDLVDDDDDDEDESFDRDRAARDWHEAPRAPRMRRRWGRTRERAMRHHGR